MDDYRDVTDLRMEQLELAVLAKHHCKAEACEMARLLREAYPWPVARERFRAAQLGQPIPDPPPPSGKVNRILSSEEMTRMTLDIMRKALTLQH